MKFAANDTTAQVLEFVRKELAGFKLNAKEMNRAEVICEESLLHLMEHSDFTKRNTFSVKVSKFLGDVIIELSVPGDETDLPAVPDTDDSEEAIRNLILRSYSHIISYKHYRNTNIVWIRASISAYSMLYKTLGALLLAAVCGLAVKHFLPEAAAFLNDNVLEFVEEIFLDGMKMCTIPVVFFSVMLSFADVRDMSGLKRTAWKLMGYFVLLQTIAVALGFSLVSFFGTGTGAHIASKDIADIGNASFSLGDMLRNIVPENIISPILDSNTLQLIVMGVLIGTAVAAKNAKLIRSAVHELNDVFMKVAEFFMRFIPLVVFCSVASIILTQGADAVVSVAGIFLTAMLGFVLMNAVCFLMVRFAARLNPLRLLKKSLPALITAFGTCSASSAITDSLKAADACGISPKLSSFAVPIGASLNKNGFCLSLSVIVMSIANMYGVNLSWLQIISLGISIVIIAPGTSWTPVIALSTLFTQAGCPVHAIGMIMSIYTLLDMADTVTCCNGTLVSTLLAAKSEGMLDTAEYNRP